MGYKLCSGVRVGYPVKFLCHGVSKSDKDRSNFSLSNLWYDIFSCTEIESAIIHLQNTKSHYSDTMHLLLLLEHDNMYRSGQTDLNILCFDLVNMIEMYNSRLFSQIYKYTSYKPIWLRCFTLIQMGVIKLELQIYDWHVL